MLVISSNRLRCRGVFISINGSEDSLSNVALLRAILKHTIALNETLNQCPLIALGEQLGLAVENTIVDLFASLCQTLEDDSESSDGLSQDASLLL